MWCDAEANLDQLSTREGIADTVRRCKEANINAIIVDVKPLCGRVLYKSDIAPRLKDWKGKPYPEDHDLLQVMIEEGHQQGIPVHAAINVFSEGSQEFRDGPAFAHPEWQCIRYEVEPDSGQQRFIRAADAPAEHLAVFVNPILPEVRQYELSIVKEIAQKYEIDGIIFDRMRYPNLYADFSDTSRDSFEKWLGQGVSNWPEDVFRIALQSGSPIMRGPLFNKWCEWRAKQIRDHLEAARNVVKTVRPEALIGAYVGSWYSVYYDVGVNWGSRNYKPKLDWTTDTYHETGYAELADYLCAGCYYEIPTHDEARTLGKSEKGTVQAGAEEAVEAVMDAAFVYGSLYLRQYEGDPDRLRRAMRAAMENTQGIMFFDLVYIRDYNWWDILRNELPNPTSSPHEKPELCRKAADLRRCEGN